MEEEMKEMIKRTAVVTLAGVMAAGMLTGCGSKTLDGTKTVATIDGTDIPLGIVSLYARQQQEQTTAMYLSFMGSADNIWDTSDDSGETYGEQAVDSSLKAVELMYLLKEKAADYNVEITDDEETAIADAASQFMSDNSEETIKELGVTEDQVKTLLELRTIQQKTHDSIVAEGNITVSDDEANQSSFTYVSISTSGDDITDDEKAEKKEQAQEILDKMKEDPTADMSEVAKEVDDSYSAVQGNFTVKESDDEDEDEDSSAYPEEVLTVLRGLTEGEVASDIIETDTGYYVVFVHGCICALFNHDIHSFRCFPDGFIHKFTILCGKSAKYMICQIPSFRLSTYAHFDTEEFLSSKLTDNVFDTIVSACASLLTDAKLTRIQVNIVVNHDQFCFRIDLEIIDHIPDGTAA